MSNGEKPPIYIERGTRPTCDLNGTVHLRQPVAWMVQLSTQEELDAAYAGYEQGSDGVYRRIVEEEQDGRRP